MCKDTVTYSDTHRNMHHHPAPPPPSRGKGPHSTRGGTTSCPHPSSALRAPRGPGDLGVPQSAQVSSPPSPHRLLSSGQRQSWKNRPLWAQECERGPRGGLWPEVYSINKHSQAPTMCRRSAPTGLTDFAARTSFHPPPAAPYGDRNQEKF